ncbi:MAG: DUF1080 domain-containing protein [Colwellia sp.]|nr:DUF1080 domain-containing protein [Colwellia sp.]
MILFKIKNIQACSIRALVGLAVVTTLLGCQKSNVQLEPVTLAHNSLSISEQQQGWQLLFDGQSSGQWRGFKRSDFPSNWQVIDGTLHMKGDVNMTADEKADRGDIVFPQQYQNFTLKLEWKISKNGNSGIFYLGSENNKQHFETGDYIWRNAPEMQILDNHGHPDANRGKNGNRQAGSLYDLIAAQPQNAKPIGQWNNIEITVNNRHVSHKQNGVIVVEYVMDTPQWHEMISHSKFPSLNPNWHNVAVQGLIGLQDHNDPVWFRNIKIKAL